MVFEVDSFSPRHRHRRAADDLRLAGRPTTAVLDRPVAARARAPDAGPEHNDSIFKAMGGTTSAVGLILAALRAIEGGALASARVLLATLLPRPVAVPTRHAGDNSPTMRADESTAPLPSGDGTRQMGRRA
jgi:hypothetical protein